MPTCSLCKENSPQVYLEYSRQYFCSPCFINFFEKKVKRTVLKYKMIDFNDKVSVAISGGKDSASLLVALKKIFPKIHLIGLHINLGIPNYSDECEKLARELAKNLDIELIVIDAKKEYNISTIDFKSTRFKNKLCSPCGVIKRYLLNKASLEHGVNKLATGHNLDDLVEFLFKHYIHGDVEEIIRIKPVSPSNHPKLITKIKPLCEITEFETIFYAELSNLPYRTKSCPLSKPLRRINREKFFNQLSNYIPNFKHLFFKSHIKRILPRLKSSYDKTEFNECSICKMPSLSSICSFCKLKLLIDKA